MKITEDTELISEQFLDNKDSVKNKQKKIFIGFIAIIIVTVLAFISAIFSPTFSASHQTFQSILIIVLSICLISSIVICCILNSLTYPEIPDILTLDAILSLCNNKPYIAINGDVAIIYYTFISKETMNAVSLSVIVNINFDDNIDYQRAYLNNGKLTVTLNKNLLEENYIVWANETKPVLRKEGGVCYAEI